MQLARQKGHFSVHAQHGTVGHTDLSHDMMTRRPLEAIGRLLMSIPVGLGIQPGTGCQWSSVTLGHNLGVKWANPWHRTRDDAQIPN
jgi:hypothetical protein